MRIAGQNVRRNIRRQIPHSRLIAQVEIHRREIAGMIALARTNRDTHHIAGLHRDGFERAKFEFRRILGDAGSEAQP